MIGKYWMDPVSGKDLRKLLIAADDAAKMLRSIYEVGYPETEDGKIAVVERLRTLEMLLSQP